MGEVLGIRHCPFCGGKARTVRYHAHAVVVRCTNCECEGPDVSANEAEAIAAWNRRSSSDEAEVVAWTWTVVRPGYMDRAWSWGKDRPHSYDATPLYASPSSVKAGVTEAMAKAALALLTAEDTRQDKLHELLETIREQIRIEVAPEHRPDGLMTNIQNAVYAMRGRTKLMDDAALAAALDEGMGEARNA